MSSPEKPQEEIVDCDDEPKLTEEEWVFVEAMGTSQKGVD